MELIVVLTRQQLIDIGRREKALGLLLMQPMQHLRTTPLIHQISPTIVAMKYILVQ